jgi:tetraacyldisaccharide 4'-kinase
MRAPAFWNAPEARWPALALAPIAALYGALTARRLKRSGARVEVRIVCVGNFTAGGAGKTPAALGLAELLKEEGERVVFLSRGYGGALSGPKPVTVDLSLHDARAVGDEPLLLARSAPTVICADRLAGAKAAMGLGASVVVMDDGLQNPALVKDRVIAVVDGGVGLGNGFCIPAGPLRAPMAAQWPLVHEVWIVGPGAAGEAVAQEAARRGKSVRRARLIPDPNTVAELAGAPLLAFAGIGRPEKFFETLREAGLDVAAEACFPDHHAYVEAEIASLVRRAEEDGLRLVTTQKDMARLSAAALRIGADAGLTALPARLTFLDV